MVVRYVGALLSLVLVLVLGCEPGPDLAVAPPDDPSVADVVAGAVATDGEDYARLHAPFIIGRVDWRETTRLAESNPARRTSRAVGLLLLPATGSRCTAFLVAADVVLTNHHCAPGRQAVRGATVAFDYEFGTSRADLRPFACDERIGGDEALDFALLRCHPRDGERPGDRYGILPLSEAVPSVGDAVYLVHQNCDYYRRPTCDYTKKYSPGAVSEVDGRVLRHGADGLGGSSGAPLLDATSHEVVALHHAGYGDPDTGRGSANEAILMRDVRAAIAADYPEVLALRGTDGPPGDGDGDDDDEGEGEEPVRAVPAMLGTGHPYGNLAHFARTFEVPGAARVRVHFPRLEVEAGCDFVRVRNDDVEAIYTGALGEVTTPWFEGAVVTVEFESDDTVRTWGFEVDRLEWAP